MIGIGTVLVAAMSLGACGFSFATGSSIDAGGSSDSPNGDAPSDGDPPPDGSPPDMTTSAWSTPLPLGLAGDDPTLTGDLLQIWINLNDDIYTATRASRFVAFGPLAKVDEVSSASPETTPEVTASGQYMVFARLIGNNDLYITERSGGGGWVNPVPLNDVNTVDHEASPTLSDDVMMLVFTRNVVGGAADIYVSTRPSTSAAWGTAAPITELNSTAHDGSPFLTGDKLTLCFDSQRDGLEHDIYCASRASANLPFSAPQPMTAINSASSDQDPWISPDGKTFVFWSDRDGSGKLWYSLRP